MYHHLQLQNEERKHWWGLSVTVRRCDTSCSTYTEIAYLVKTNNHTKESKVGTFPNSLYRKMAWTPSDQIKRTTFILQGQFIVIPMQKVCYWFLAQTDLLTSLDFKFARLKSNFSQSWWRRPQKCFRPSLYLY